MLGGARLGHDAEADGLAPAGRRRGDQALDDHFLLVLVVDGQDVDGDGVIGQTPTLGPGERFSYTSGAPLSAPSGIMSGTYDLEGEDGRMLIATIPMFSLDSPYETALPC